MSAFDPPGPAEPWVRFEDEHLLVVSKPTGVNTHRADAHGQDGMHEWVQRRRPGVSLSTLHRLDKGTSGLLVFGKSALANRSISEQWASRAVEKRYELLTPTVPGRAPSLTCDRPIGPGTRRPGEPQAATTDFVRLDVGPELERWEARPHTGRTHQVRIHAAALGLPIVGDEEHGGRSGRAGARLFLHAPRLRFDHPTSGPLDLVDERPASFAVALAESDPVGPHVAAIAAHEARASLFDPADTDAWLWIDRHHDGFPDVRVERLGDVALAVSHRDAPLPDAWLDSWTATADLRAVYELRRPKGGGGEPAALVRGSAHPRFEVVESGVRYRIDLEASATSSGLFLDQRETRRHLLASDLAGRTVLNAFAHTGSLSVAAARSGAETLTLDLSKRYLDWARDNFRANDLDPDEHDFIYGDALDWMDRLAKRGRTFDLVLVDPPSTSTTGKRGRTRWVADRDLHELIERAARLTAEGGTLYVSTNLRRMTWRQFEDHLEWGLTAAGRSGTVDTRTLPIDHRSGPGDPPYLKAAWVALDVASELPSPPSAG